MSLAIFRCLKYPRVVTLETCMTPELINLLGSIMETIPTARMRQETFRQWYIEAIDMSHAYARQAAPRYTRRKGLRLVSFQHDVDATEVASRPALRAVSTSIPDGPEAA